MYVIQAKIPSTKICLQTQINKKHIETTGYYTVWDYKLQPHTWTDPVKYPGSQ